MSDSAFIDTNILTNFVPARHIYTLVLQEHRLSFFFSLKE